MKMWAAYAGAALAVVVAAAGAASLALGEAAARAVWFSAVLAWGLQLVAFALLVWVHGQARLFVVGWVGGMGLRFLALGVLTFVATRTRTFPPEPLLVSFVAFLFLLILLEPVFLKRGLRTT